MLTAFLMVTNYVMQIITIMAIICTAFNAYPAACATPNSPSADTKDNDGATASASATATTPTDTMVNITYPMDGSNVDKQDEETPLAPSSAGSSQDEQHQQLFQSAAPDSISTYVQYCNSEQTLYCVHCSLQLIVCDKHSYDISCYHDNKLLPAYLTPS